MMGVPTFYTRLLDDPRFTARSDRAYAAVRLRLGAAAGRNPCAVRGAHRPPHPGTLRHDRNQHEHLEPL